VFGRILIVVALLCLLVGPYFGPVPALLRNQMAIEPAVLLLLVGFLISFSLIIVVALKVDGKGLGEVTQWLRTLGLGRPTRWPAAVAGGVVGLAWAALILMSMVQFDPAVTVMAFSSFRFLAAILAAVGALLEDIITRGYLMNRLCQINVPNWAQVLIAALVFALYHTLWAFNLASFIASVVYGLILSGLFLWGKRSLTPVILGHSLVVLLSEPFATMLIFLAPSL